MSRNTIRHDAVANVVHKLQEDRPTTRRRSEEEPKYRPRSYSCAWLTALAAKSIGRSHQGATVRRIEGAMACIGSDMRSASGHE